MTECSFRTETKERIQTKREQDNKRLEKRERPVKKDNFDAVKGLRQAFIQILPGDFSSAKIHSQQNNFSSQFGGAFFACWKYDRLKVSYMKKVLLRR